jgi:hypothetical protein
MNRSKISLGLAGLALASCMAAQDGVPVSRLDEPALQVTLLPAPPAETDSCWARAQQQAAENDASAEDPLTWFETPCIGSEPAFVTALQRALKARGLYPHALTGALDGPTRLGIRLYQAPLGLDSTDLSLAAARKLGLVAVENLRSGDREAAG